MKPLMLALAAGCLVLPAPAAVIMEFAATATSTTLVWVNGPGEPTGDTTGNPRRQLGQLTVGQDFVVLLHIDVPHDPFAPGDFNDNGGLSQSRRPLVTVSIESPEGNLLGSEWADVSSLEKSGTILSGTILTGPATFDFDFSVDLATGTGTMWIWEGANYYAYHGYLEAQVTAITVPEPASPLTLALLGLIAISRRRRKSTDPSRHSVAPHRWGNAPAGNRTQI